MDPASPPIRPAIGLVCKAPRPGAVKTRLARGIGDDAAVALAEAFIRDTAAAIASLPVAPWLIHAPAEAAEDIAALLPGPFRAHPQRRGDLGTMMLDALETMLAAGHAAAVLVGADAPDVPRDRWPAALAAVQDPAVDAVFGPVADGGYWLVGMRRVVPALFRGMPWSTSDVLARTCRVAASEGVRVTLLEPWFDVDEPADLDAMRQRLRLAGPDIAVATRTALARLPAR